MMPNMEIGRIKDAVMAFSQQALGKAGYVVGVTKAGGDWKAILEVLEEKGFIDDMLGIYEITLDGEMNVTSYQRKGLRRRSDVSLKDWQKEK